MSTTESKNGTTPIDTAFEQATDLSEQFAAAARKAGNLYLDSYEKAVDRAVKLELELAGLTKQEWLKTMIEAQADLTKDVVNAYTTTARTLLK
jgi:hypothetical protein